MSDEEFDAWDLYNIDCIVESPYNIANPLAREMLWWSQIYSDAADRVQADPRFIEALNAEKQCFINQGYSDDLDDERAGIDDEAVELTLGSQPVEDAVTRLYELADHRDRLDEMSRLCTHPRDRVNNQIFRELIREATVRDPQVGLWMAELQRTVDEYQPEIDLLTGG